MPTWTKDCSRSSPPSSEYSGVRSRNAPTVVNVGDCVLPISTTSGVFAASGSAVVSLVTRSPHACSSMTRVDPGFSAANVSIR